MQKPDSAKRLDSQKGFDPVQELDPVQRLRSRAGGSILGRGFDPVQGARSWAGGSIMIATLIALDQQRGVSAWV